MPYTTPIFGFQAPLEEELAYLAPSQLQAMVNRLEAVLKDRAAVPDLSTLNDVVGQLNLVKARLNALEADTGWLDPATLAGFSFTAGNGAGPDLFRVRLRAGRVEVKCHGVRNSGGTATGPFTFCTLPTAYRPSQVLWFTWLKYGGIATEAKINPNGTLVIGATIEQGSGFVGVASYLL